MKAITLLFGLIPLPGTQEIPEDHLTHYLVVTTQHNARPWWRRLTRRVIKGYQDPYHL